MHEPDPLLRLAKLMEKQHRELLVAQEVHYRQTEALLAIHSQISFRAILPPFRQWAIGPDFATILIQAIRDHQTEQIVELGSGISTLISGYCIEQQGRGRVVAIDHDETYVTQTREHIRRHGLESSAVVRHAKLSRLKINEDVWSWYDCGVLQDLRDVDLLVVDGPPQANNPQPHARYPALPFFFERMRPGGIILVDDMGRDHEREVVNRWLREFNVSVGEKFPTERGAALLRKLG